jgi:hypothetical protein
LHEAHRMNHSNPSSTPSGNLSPSRASRRGMPIKFYLGAVAVFNMILGSLVFRDRLGQSSQSGQKDASLPRTFTIEDAIFLGVSTHKLSRTITKDVVTTPFRSPFTEVKEYLGYGEVQEEALGDGARQVIGELLSCQYCADMWVALALLFGLKQMPERTRVVFKFFSAVALADFLHVFYEHTRTRSNVLTLREEKLEQQQKKTA